MNDINPGSEPVESTPPPVPYKDRSVGLTVFGILTILLGCLAGLFVLLMLFGQALSARTAAPAPANFQTLLPVASIYGILAVVLVWLGIGSVMARRWARALLLIFSWSWLIIGVLALVCMAFVMPKIMATLPTTGTNGQPALPSAAMSVAMVVMFLFMGIYFVVLPAAWTVFYSSLHVKATCEARDPVRRWTDACPLPVLVISLWAAVSVLSMLMMPVMVHGVMPFFGVFLAGIPGTLVCLAWAAIWAYAAWALYKLEQRGWWVIVIGTCVMVASSLLTFARHDMMEMYKLIGYPEAQIEQMQTTGLMVGNSMAWLMLLGLLPFLGYLLYIRKYFRRQL
jgi:hypothetical protein